MIEKRRHSSLSCEYDVIHVDKAFTHWIKFTVQKRGTRHYVEQKLNIETSIILEKLRIFACNVDFVHIIFLVSLCYNSEF